MTLGTASTTDREITATRLFDAPRELVFDAWTDREHMSNWWGPVGFSTTTHAMDLRPGGEWRFTMHGPDGTDYPNRVIYREVVRPERLVYAHDSGRDDEPGFEVTVTFAEERGRTIVNVRMLFPTAEERTRVAEEFGAVEGLHQTLDRLAQDLARAAGHPAVFVISHEVDAPRELVFRVWTETDHLRGWFGPKGMPIVTCSNELRPGGVFHYGMRMPDGATLWGRWVWREIDPPERIVFVSSFSDDRGGRTRNPWDPNWPLETLSTVTFFERDGRTILTIRGEPLEASEREAAVFAAGRKSMHQGWRGTMEQLEAWLESVGSAEGK